MFAGVELVITFSEFLPQIQSEFGIGKTESETRDSREVGSGGPAERRETRRLDLSICPRTGGRPAAGGSAGTAQSAVSV